MELGSTTTNNQTTTDDDEGRIDQERESVPSPTAAATKAKQSGANPAEAPSKRKKVV